jgi:hypothetical protein
MQQWYKMQPDAKELVSVPAGDMLKGAVVSAFGLFEILDISYTARFTMAG